MKKMRLTIATLLAVVVALTGLSAAATLKTVLDPPQVEVTDANGNLVTIAGAGITLTPTIIPNGVIHTVVVNAPGGPNSFKLRGISYTSGGLLYNTGYNVGDKFTVAITGEPPVWNYVSSGYYISVPGPIPFPDPQKFVVTYTNDKGAKVGDDYYEEYSATYVLDGITYTMRLRLHIIVENDVYIPEFPAIALPVAAVIGLVFFFRNKRRKDQ